MKAVLKPKIILVLGMHRSGTSLVAQLIAKWGAYMGKELMSANTYNQDGYWEYQPLVDFHEKVLQKTNNTWYAPSEAFDVKQLLLEFGDEARELVEQMDKEGKVWCWKDPRMVLFLDFWKVILEGRDIVFIITNRRLEAVASSLFNRDKYPAFISNALWEFSTYKIIEALTPKIKYKWIDYDKIISEPEIAISELFLFLNNSLQITENQKVYDHMIRTVKKSLNHAKPNAISKLSPFQLSLQKIVIEGHIPEDYKIPQNQLWFLQEIFALFRKTPVENRVWLSAQLYFRNESTEFNENQSLIQEIRGNSNIISFKFDKHSFIKQFRFDPLNDYVSIHINTIQLFNQGKLIEIELKLSSNALFSENREYLFDTTDPQVFIDFPLEKSVELDEFIIDLEYLQKGYGITEQLLKHKNNEIEILKNKSLILNNLLQTADYKGDCLEQKLYENNITLQKQAEKIDLQSGLLNTLKKSNDEILKQYNNLEMQIGRLNSELLNIKKSFSYKFFSLLNILLLVFNPLKFIGLIKRRLKSNRNFLLIRQSDFFNSDYYLKNNPDVKQTEKSAIRHYLIYGGFEGRKPSEKFDSASYLIENPDIKENGMNPLLHYIKYGEKEGRMPHNTAFFKEIEKHENEEGFQEHILNYPEKMIVRFPTKLRSFYLESNWETKFINTYFDRIYVINLRRRQNKLAEIVQKLNGLNICAEIIEAVDGYKSPHIDEYETYKNTPLGLGNAHKNEILEKRKMIYSPGVWGHLKSNRLILEDAIKKGYQRILILEDDAVFIKDFHREFAKFTEIISGKEWKFIYLGASQPCWDIPECIVYSDKSVTEYDSIQPYYHPWQTNGSFALALHQSQFRSIIDKIDEMNCPFDWIYKYSFKHLSDECYVAQPNLIIADTSVSDNRPGDITSEQKALAIKKRKWDLKKYDFI